MLRMGIAFLLGHCCIHCLPALPGVSHALLWWIFAGASAALLFACGLQRRLRCRVPVTGAVLVLAFAGGALWAWSHAAARLAEDLPVALEGKDVLIRGYVASLPDSVGADPQFELDVWNAPAGVPRRVRLSWYESTAQPRAGESWQLLVRLKRRNGFANPGGFDYEAFLFRSGIGASGYVRDDARNRRLAAPSPRHAVLRAREWISGRLRSAVGDHAMLGVLQGLAVGDTNAMSARQWRVFAATGTTHLMAISGLHISMIAALCAWLGGRVCRWGRMQRWRLDAIHGQVLGGVCGALVYSLLAGLSVPTQRTLLMLCVYFAARWWRRELNAGQTIGLALMGVLLWDPFAPLAVGAWLSFGAVAVLLLAVSSRLTNEGAIRNFARVQMAVTVGLVPLLIAAFGTLSVVSPLANAIAVPLFTCLLVPLVLMGSVAAALWLPAGGVVLGIAAAVLEACWPAMEWLASLPLATWHFPRLPVAVSAALALGSLLWVLPGIWPLRLVASMLCVPALVYRPATPARGEFMLTLLDVGQGLSAVIRTGSHTLVFDAGPAFRTGTDAGELVVLPYLRSQGVRRVDALLVSHGDLDHRGGMRSIVAGMPVGQVLLGPSVDAPDLHAQPCRRGQRWSWDGVSFEVLHPAGGGYRRANDSSCVLRVEGRAGSALLTGDIQRDSESELLAAGVADVDVVVAPHHGSRTSSTQPFVDATSPRLVLFATGYRNRWAFPKQDVVLRWQAAGARTFATADTGAIDVLVGAAPLSAGLYRRDARHYWRAR